MQIKQAVATGAVSLAAVGGVLVAVSVGIQGIAKAEVPQYKAPGSENTTSCAVGSIGVFTSTYTPECANLPGVPFESATTEYWPLFPAQNRYGMQFLQYGLGKTPFNTCDQYIPESILTVQAGTSYMISQQLSGAVGLFFGMFFDNVPLFMQAVLSDQGYNMTSFPSSDFAGIQAASRGTPFASVNDLILDTCTKNGTTAECVQALNQVVNNSTTDFTQPVGQVYTGLRSMLGDFIIVSNQVPALKPLTPALVMNRGLAEGCEASNATNIPACAQASVPTQINGTNYPLAAALIPKTGDFLDFMTAVLNIPEALVPESFKPLFLQLAAVANSVLLCNDTGFTNDAQVCFARTVGYDASIEVFNGFYPYLKFPARLQNSIPEGGNFTAGVQKECQEDAEDLSVIGTSQKLVISALFFVFFGVVIAIPVVVSQKLRWLVAPASSVLLAAVLLLAGLLTLNTAPVYKTLGYPCDPTSMCYFTQASIPLAVAAMVLMFVASVTLFVQSYRSWCVREQPIKEHQPADPALHC